MSQLKGKRILFIGPVFYHYHQEIITELEQKGAAVDFFPERDYTIRSRVYKRLGKKTYQGYQRRYYTRLFNQFKANRYDIFLLIKGEIFPFELAERIRQSNPGINMVLYQWDSMVRVDYADLIPAFDKVATFDSEDSKKYGLNYQPLFYTREIDALKKIETAPLYDLLLLGMYLPERYLGLERLLSYSERHHLRFKYHLFLQKTHYFMQKLKRRPIDLKFCSFETISYREVLKLYAQSKVIVDFSNVSQSGLSMRVVEALGAGKKLVTTNKNIQQESFYNPSYIHVINPVKIEIPASFWDSTIMHDNELNHLRLDNWLEILLQ